jgi:hypothetical protein
VFALTRLLQRPGQTTNTTTTITIKKLLPQVLSIAEAAQ